MIVHCSIIVVDSVDWLSHHSSWIPAAASDESLSGRSGQWAEAEESMGEASKTPPRWKMVVSTRYLGENGDKNILCF